MERKEHPVPVIQKGGEVLEFLDSEGNPFKPSGSVKYQLIAEDGSILSEGTLDENSNTVSLSGVSSKTFKVMVDSHFVVEISGVKALDEESGEPVEQIDELVIPPSSDDPDDELALPEDFDEDQPIESDSGTDSETNEDEDTEDQNQDADDSEDESDAADKDAEEKDSGDDKEEEESSDNTEDEDSSDEGKSDDAKDEETSDSDDDNVDEGSDESDSDKESEG
jgi:clumping factor B